jgi:hypothetical protein
MDGGWVGARLSRLAPVTWGLSTVPVTESPRFPDVTLGMISWKAPQTVAHTFASYKSADILDLFGARRIHFNEWTEADLAIASAHDFSVTRTDANVGIFGAVDALVAATTTPYLLFVENDCPVIATLPEFIKTLSGALSDMQTLGVPVFSMRSRRQPGDQFLRRERYEKRFRVIWPLGAPSSTKKHMTNPLQRAYEDARRSALRGSAIYAEEDPTLRHPAIITRSRHGNWITSSPYLQWSNNCFLARTDFIQDVILNQVRLHPAKTNLNGTQDIEAALKVNRWWRKQSFRMGQCENGPFTHDRLDR